MNGSILCMVDDCEGLSPAEVHAAGLSRLTGLRLILLYVTERVMDAAFVATDSPGWRKVFDDWADEGKRLLEKKEALVKEDGYISVKKEFRSGDKAYETISVAIEQNVAVIVMPRYGNWSIRNLINASFANKIVEHSPCEIIWVNV